MIATIASQPIKKPNLIGKIILGPTGMREYNMISKERSDHRIERDTLTTINEELKCKLNISDEEFNKIVQKSREEAEQKEKERQDNAKSECSIF